MTTLEIAQAAVGAGVIALMLYGIWIIIDGFLDGLEALAKYITETKQREKREADEWQD